MGLVADSIADVVDREYTKARVEYRPIEWDTEVYSSVTTKHNVPYKIFQIKEPCFVYGFVDLSNIRNGDDFEITIYSRITQNETDEKVFERTKIENQRDEPIVSWSGYYFPFGMSVSIRQTKGLSKKLNYVWCARTREVVLPRRLSHARSDEDQTTNI